MTAVVTTRALTKRYGSVTAVEDLSLEVFEGDLFGFLGPNGSGKTTTLRMLLGLVYPTAGDIEVLGLHVPAAMPSVLSRIGSLIEGPGFYPHLSGRANLAIMDASGAGSERASRRRRIGDALEQVMLAKTGRLPYRAYSTGMKQRLGLAGALLRPHELLILDEPTNGLDPAGTREVRDLLVELVKKGTTIMLSSHLLGEIELICTRVAVVHRGRLIAQARVDELLGPTGRVRIVTPDLDATERVLNSIASTHIATRQPNAIVAELNGLATDELTVWLVEGGVRVHELIAERPRLEDVFLKLTSETG
ncbi:MAG: ABC transporter ATP-binding protein [Actinobacteria bacterium]|nr:ABC transporter ATP-binding protein [Actinomycetota bacterium]